MKRFKLETGRDYFNLSRTCRTNYRMLIGRAWNDLHIHFRPDWLQSNSQPVTRCRGIYDGAVQIISVWQMTPIRHRRCPVSPCEACEIEVALLSVNAHLDRRAKKFGRDLRGLRLSGRLPQTLGSMNEDAPGHTLKDAGGMCGLSPEVLNIELRWATWSPLLLCSFDLTRLRSLKMPVRAPLDCLTIGAAFLGMPRLADLTITDLCDSQAFVEEFRHLGDGILALSSSLRSLVIEITNCNRAEGWEQDKAFVEPGDSAFLFKAFFPEPSCKRIETLIRARYDDPREPLDVNIFRSSQGQLNLEHIRLKHIGLPWWSFQTVFNSRTIKGLDLPMCRVTPSVWDDLGKHAQLHKLANIDYEMFSGTPALMSFLSTQSRLQILSFKRPPDLYQIAGTTSLDHGQADSTSFSVKEAAPHLGLGTEWGRAHARDAWLLQSSKSWIQHEYLIQSPSSWIYFDNLIRSLSPYIDYQYPKKSDFVKILSDKLLLRHLIIPADMFDVTPSFMACLAGELPALESIELGFDYACPVSQSTTPRRPMQSHH